MVITSQIPKSPNIILKLLIIIGARNRIIKSAVIADAIQQLINAAYEHYRKAEDLQFPPINGNSNADEFICEKILGNA